MFTGIITHIGTVRSVSRAAGDARFAIDADPAITDAPLGASIACAGCCLTVVETGAGWFAVDVSAETLSRTSLGTWGEGTRVNLERSLKVGDELGGHYVSGHVDGLARVDAVVPEGDSERWTFSVPPALAPFMAEKGSVALDGVSLTVNDVEGARFGVNLIPHTRAVTTFGDRGVGDPVHLEVDMIARYVARLLDARRD